MKISHFLSRRPGRLLVAVTGVALLSALTLPIAGPAQAATSPDPLFLLQGGEIGQFTCDYTSAGTKSLDVVKAFSALHPTAAVTTVPYSVCDGRGSTGTDVLNYAARQLAQKIDPLPDTQKVDVLAFSLGTVVARQCLLMAYASTSNTAYQSCKQIDDLVLLAPPSKGTYAPVLPPVDETTCRTYASACKRLSSGPHLSMQNLCGVFLPLAQKACGSLHPNSAYQQAIRQGAPGVPDETPGGTAYSVIYSYSDEFVFLNTTTTIGSPHPSPLNGAYNVAANNETHLSSGQLTNGQRVRITGRSTNLLDYQIRQELLPTTTALCTDDIAQGIVMVLDDRFAHVVNTPSTPVIAACDTNGITEPVAAG